MASNYNPIETTIATQTQAPSSDKMGGLTALILGATGAVGKPLLSELVSSPCFVRVHEVGRRLSSHTQGKDQGSSGADNKLVQHPPIDFDGLLAAESSDNNPAVATLKDAAKDADVVFVTLGTTKANAGGAEQFKKIDRDYVVKAAQIVAGEGKRVLYCSAQMANSSSSFLYPRCKGETEESLASAGFDEAIIFRPGFLAQAERPQKRYLEEAFGFFATNVISKVTDGAAISVQTLARAMRIAGEQGLAGLDGSGRGLVKKDERLEKVKAKGTDVGVVGNASAVKLGSAAA